MADDCGGLAIARSLAEGFQRGVNPVVLRRIHGVRLPSERLEYRPELRHGKNQAAENIKLAVVVIDEDAEIVQVLRARIHHGFPNRTLLQFTVAEDGIGIESAPEASSDRETLRHAEALTHWAGSDLNSGQHRTGMAVQNALERARVLQDLGVEVAQLGIDGSQRGDGVALAEYEHVASDARRIFHIGRDEATVIERDQGNHGRERSAGMQPFIHCIARLIERQDTDIRILDGEQLKNTLPQQRFAAIDEFPALAAGSLQRSR